MRRPTSGDEQRRSGRDVRRRDAALRLVRLVHPQRARHDDDERGGVDVRQPGQRGAHAALESPVDVVPREPVGVPFLEQRADDGPQDDAHLLGVLGGEPGGRLTHGCEGSHAC